MTIILDVKTNSLHIRILKQTSLATHYRYAYLLQKSTLKLAQT